MALDFEKYRFTVQEFHQMGEAGIFDEDARVELIDGEIVKMTPIGDRHYLTTIRVDDAFHDAFRGAAQVAVQSPVRLGKRSEPQPDVALVRLGITGVPGTRDVLLLVEVADTTLEPDRRVKIPLYARAGIPEVWLVDLKHNVVEVYTDPTADRYAKVRLAHRSESIAPEALPDRSVAVNDLLPNPDGSIS